MKNNPKARQHPVINCPPPLAHAKGRFWLRESPNSIWVEIMADETHVATIPYKTKEQIANAQRIVKAVNILSTIEQKICILDTCIVDTDLRDAGMVEFKLLKELLKQAKQ